MYRFLQPELPDSGDFCALGLMKSGSLLSCSMTTQSSTISASKQEACLGGKYTGDKQDIRVFSIEYIKGLEFQAVFFIALDQQKVAEDELLMKFFYVGLSRANFFLAATVMEEWPQALAVIENDFVVGKWMED